MKAWCAAWIILSFNYNDIFETLSIWWESFYLVRLPNMWYDLNNFAHMKNRPPPPPPPSPRVLLITSNIFYLSGVLEYLFLLRPKIYRHWIFWCLIHVMLGAVIVQAIVLCLQFYSECQICWYPIDVIRLPCREPTATRYVVMSAITDNVSSTIARQLISPLQKLNVRRG